MANPISIRVFLIHASVLALQDAVEVTEDSRTDVINKAIQLYALMSRYQAEGMEFLVHEPKTGYLRQFEFGLKR